jgi:hypothetical protein
VGLRVLADPEAADHDVVERDMEDAILQVDVADLQCAQLTPRRR